MTKKAQIDFHWEFDADTGDQQMSAVITRPDGSFDKIALESRATSYQTLRGPGESLDFALEVITKGGKSGRSATAKVRLGDLINVIAIDPDSPEPVIPKNVGFNVAVIDEPDAPAETTADESATVIQATDAMATDGAPATDQAVASDQAAAVESGAASESQANVTDADPEAAT